MKDTIRKLISSVIAIAGLGILGFYVYNGNSIVAQGYAQYTTLVIGIFAVLFLAFFLQFGIVVIPGNKLKIKGIIAGLIMILGGNYLLVNNAANKIYASDIVMLLGVASIYLTVAGLIVTKKAEKAVQSGKQTIIEV